jgi:hypothetical protein
MFDADQCDASAYDEGGEHEGDDDHIASVGLAPLSSTVNSASL